MEASREAEKPSAAAGANDEEQPSPRTTSTPAVAAAAAGGAAAGENGDEDGDEYGGSFVFTAEMAQAVAAAEEDHEKKKKKADEAAAETAARDRAARKADLIKAQRDILNSTLTGKQGRYSKSVQRRREKAKAELELLLKDLLPGERHVIPPPLTANETLDSASTPHNAAHVAGATRITPAGRRGGARSTPATAGGENKERTPPPTTHVVDSDDEGDGEEQEDEEARASFFYAIPEVAQERIKQVTQQCKAGALDKAQSPVFLPPDPVKSSSRTSVSPFIVPPVYIHAWHKYFASTGIPPQPPCPTHGWKAAENRQVIGKGWRQGRRVSGVSQDMFMIGTKHRCNICREEKKSLKARADEWKGEEDEKQRRTSAWKSKTFVFRSYAPPVTKMYYERYPWIAAANRAIVCTSQTMSLPATRPPAGTAIATSAATAAVRQRNIGQGHHQECVVPAGGRAAGTTEACPINIAQGHQQECIVPARCGAAGTTLDATGSQKTTREREVGGAAGAQPQVSLQRQPVGQPAALSVTEQFEPAARSRREVPLTSKERQQLCRARKKQRRLEEQQEERQQKQRNSPS